MILVVGATGMLGGMIARRLLERGERVRVLIRPGSNGQPLVDAGAEAVEGDLKDRASLDRAVREGDTVITTANSAMRGGEDNVETVDSQGNRDLIDAARAAGVERFIFTSAMGASADAGRADDGRHGDIRDAARHDGHGEELWCPAYSGGGVLAAGVRGNGMMSAPSRVQRGSNSSSASRLFGGSCCSSK